MASSLGGCGEAGGPDSRSETAPRSSDTPGDDPRPAPAALRALLARNLGPLADAMAQVAVEVRAPGDEAPTTLLAAVPERIRRMTPDGRTAIRTPDGALVWQTGGAARPADDVTTAELDAWLTALDLVTLGPFRRAVSVRRSAPDTLEVEVDGEPHAIRYRADDDTILEVRGRGSRIQILERHDSGAARIPTRIAGTPLGERTLRFLGTGVGFDPGAFEAPTRTGEPARAEIVLGGTSSPHGPRAESMAAVSWWMVEDPGSWDARLECIRSAGRRLGAAGYGNGGDPMLVDEDGAQWLVVPFRPARSDPDPVVPEAGEKILERAAEAVLVVDPPPGPTATRVANARRELLAHAQDSGIAEPRWTAVSWNLIGRDPANDPGCLDRAPLRVMLGLGR